jgi:hypothetical protein
MPAKLVIKKADAPVAESPGRWKAGRVVMVVETTAPLGSQEEPSAGNFVHFVVTNRTVAEMQQYLAPYNRAIEMFVIAGPDPNGFRRINVVNNNCNASGTIGAWTVEATNAVIAEWNSRYPTCGLVTVAFPQPNTWTCEGTFTPGQAVEFEQVLIEFGLSVMDTRRIWYINQTGMNNIIAAGGTQTGTSVQLNNILRDARDD